MRTDNPSTAAPQVTVIVPCRNEAGNIRRCLDSILGNDFPPERFEVLVADGQSDDGTRAIVEEFARSHPAVRLLDNPQRTAAAGLNRGIAEARGQIIMRMDAHNEYAPDYVRQLVECLEKSGADNVGGVCVTVPANDTHIARAIAVGMSHPLGVGNSYFRIGAAEPRWVDTVPFGCYRREVFQRIGLFDEELVRNQDDEFNLRLIRHGGRILLVPSVKAYYSGRDSLANLWRMYYQYGYFKPLVARKVGSVMTVRQVIPSLFLLTLAATGLAAPWSLASAAAFAVILLAWAGTVALCAAQQMPARGVRCALWLLLVFPVMHFSYGLGYLRGIVDFLVLRRKRAPAAGKVPLSR